MVGSRLRPKNPSEKSTALGSEISPPQRGLLFTAMQRGKSDVVFAVLPFAEVNRPAIGVSLLKSEIRLQDFSSRIEYLNLRLAELIGLTLYQRIVSEFAPTLLAGEWFFADSVFPDGLPPEDDYLVRVLSRYCRPDDTVLDDLRKARQVRDEYLRECVGRILESAPRVVGFTTTFHQTCACLAVAKRLKAESDPPAIVFGGANCADDMGVELIRSFPWIDYVCCGEADLSFPALLEKIIRNTSHAAPPGVLTRAEINGPKAPETVQNLDSLPPPDYSDYFEQAPESPLDPQLRKGLPIETSRGCWWGAKQRCVFCGLNADPVSFRSKTARRALDEIMSLTARYGLKRVEFSDNMLDLHYVDELFPLLNGSGLDLFYEVKANLRYEQLLAMRAGGVGGIQPGIESLSDEVLRLMRKGCTAAQNIQLLRWCEEIGIEAVWNLLTGLPGESASEYERMAAIVPLLTHLPPPVSCSPLRLDRFSPLFLNAAAFGLTRVRPASAYYYVFPLGRRELSKLAYYFDYDHLDGRDPWSYMRGLQQELFRWTQLRMAGPDRRPKLDALSVDDAIEITDTREIAPAQSQRLTGPAAQIYTACDRGQTLQSLARSLRWASGELALRAELAALRDSKLLLEIGERFLSLAVFRNRPETQKAKSPHVDIALRETTSSEQLLRMV